MIIFFFSSTTFSSADLLILLLFCVHVPCSFPHLFSSVVNSHSFSAISIALKPPSPSSAVLVTWKASPVIPYLLISPYIFALRFFACSYSSNTRTPAASPSTKPDLSLSQGRDPFVDDYFNVVHKALAAAQRDIPNGQIEAAAPPKLSTATMIVIKI